MKKIRLKDEYPWYNKLPRVPFVIQLKEDY